MLKHKVGFNGNINYFTFCEESYKEKFYFKYKIFLKDSEEYDLSFYKNNIKNDNVNVKKFLKLIKNKNNLNINLENEQDYLINLKRIYRSYISLFDDYTIYDVNNIDKDNINTDLLNALNYYRNLKDSYINQQQSNDILYK